MALDANKLRTALETITDLPTLPVVVSSITGQLANPATSAADIGRLIEQDQAQHRPEYPGGSQSLAFSFSQCAQQPEHPSPTEVRNSNKQCRIHRPSFNEV